MLCIFQQHLLIVSPMEDSLRHLLSTCHVSIVTATVPPLPQLVANAIIPRRMKDRVIGLNGGQFPSVFSSHIIPLHTTIIAGMCLHELFRQITLFHYAIVMYGRISNGNQICTFQIHISIDPFSYNRQQSL